jgi:hypothetical protein
LLAQHRWSGIMPQLAQHVALTPRLDRNAITIRLIELTLILDASLDRRSGANLP